MGLKVGDTIEGTERVNAWWNTARLTLLWLGETEAVWRMTDRNSNRPHWSEPREAANWTLSYRDWRKVGRLTLPPKAPSPAQNTHDPTPSTRPNTILVNSPQWSNHVWR
jgi:hypothetical protein